MSDATETIYTAASDDMERLVSELKDAADNYNWAEVGAKAEAIKVLAPLINLVAGHMGDNEQ
jgi:hypothetical protein